MSDQPNGKAGRGRPARPSDRPTTPLDLLEEARRRGAYVRAEVRGQVYKIVEEILREHPGNERLIMEVAEGLAADMLSRDEARKREERRKKP